MSSNIIKRSILAGVLISIGALFSIAGKVYGPVVGGLCFSVGLFGVLCCEAKLFTGSVLDIRSVWDGERPLSGVIGTWAAVWALNLVGAVIVALMASQTGIDKNLVVTAATNSKMAMPWHELLIRAVLCNVMVCMSVWTFKRSDGKVADALAACVLPVACFVACGWEHSVADMFYMALACIANPFKWPGFLYVVGLSTIGNVIGGTAFSWLVWGKE